MLLPREVIIDTAMSLGLSETSRGTCPYCEASEKSLVVTRTAQHEAAYICHRATCSAKGYVTLMAGTVPAQQSYLDKRNEFVKQLVALPASVAAILDNRYGIDLITAMAAGWRWAPSEDEGKGRVYMPIRSSNDRIVGSTLRSLDKTVVPKSKIYLEDPAMPLLAWYTYYHRDALPLVVIVEGQLDGVKVAKVASRAAALLGCNFDEHKARAIQAECAARKLRPVLWLDPDAFDKALAFKRKYEPLLPNLLIVQSKYDPKDMDVEDIKKTLVEVSSK